MAEYIERKAFIEDIKTEIINLKLNGWKGTPRPCEELYDFIDRIKEQPAADVVEVVRCRECKHWKKDVPGRTGLVVRRGLAGYMVGAAGYCVYGERRGDDA